VRTAHRQVREFKADWEISYLMPFQQTACPRHVSTANVVYRHLLW
jgi:hypothetical protein